MDSDGTMQFLGNLPYLAILELWIGTFDVEGLHLDFLPQAFPSLVALKLTSAQRCTDDGGEINVKSVQFKEGEALKVIGCSSLREKGGKLGIIKILTYDSN